MYLFFKNTNSKEKSNTEVANKLWVNLTSDNGVFGQILIGYVEGATNFWDNNYDAVTMDANKYLDFYSINEGSLLTIQGRALPFEENQIIPFFF